MAKTFSLTSKSYDGRYMTLSCTQTPDIATNKSTIDWTLTVTGGNSDFYTTGPTTVKINSKQVYYKAQVAWNEKVFPAKKGSTSGSLTVSHNTDGSLTIPVSLATAIYTSSVTTKSGNWELDKIPRGASISAAPNFTDEENPTITYSNPAGSAVEALVAGIYDAAGSVAFAAYRAIDIDETSYTFTLSDAEREALRKATPNSNSLDVKFYIRTTISGTNFYSSVAKKMTIANGNPTLNPTVEDEYTASIELTGDANKIIKGYNSIKVNSGGAALKGASIKSQKITCGKEVINASSGTFTDVESASFVFSITDSRGNTTTKTINKTLIDYIKLTCNQEAQATVDGKITFNIKGNYFNGSFGDTNNSLVVEYRYKEDGGEYGEWIPATATKSGNTYTAIATATGLDYRKAYIVQSRATDEITTASTQEKKVKAIPVFDWGENDFEFNVPVKDQDGNFMSPVSFEHGDSFGHVHYGNGLLIQWGNVVITPTAANTITALTVKFPIAFDEVPRVKVDAQTQYPNAITHSIGPALDGVTIYSTRTTTAATRFQWEARGYKAVSE